MKRIITLIILLGTLCLATISFAAAPSVTSWSPTNGATGVDENTSIVITFSSNPTLNGTTITSSNLYMKTGTSCSGGTAVSASFTSSLGNPVSTVTVTPSVPLTSGQTYVVCARTGIKNTSNQSLTANSQTSFTVRDYVAPTITIRAPDPPSGVQSNNNPTIQITFSERMDQTTINTSTVLLENITDGVPVSLNNPTFADLTSPNRTRADFTLPAVLASPKTYRVTVLKNNVKDLGGNALNYSDNYTWEFSIDNTAPTVISYTPFTAESPVYVNTATPVISAVFTEPITSPTTSNFYLKQGSTTITTTPSFDSGTFTASLGGFTLANNTTYTAVLLGNATAVGAVSPCNVNSTSNGIKDLLLNKLATTLCWSFIVDTQAPAVATVSPINGAGNVAVSSAITVDFTENQALRESTINATTVQVSDGTNTIPCTLSYVAATKRLTITPPGGAFNYNTTYTVSLGGGLADKAGNLLPDYSFSFTTQPVSSVVYTQIPPFLNAPVTPNILIILDNSNSMDEDMQVNAIGSPFCSNNADPNTCSKSIIARKALTNIINTYANNMRIGLMSYKLSGASSYVLHNTFYFSSYDPATYCPDPPTACNDYCVTESTTSRDACNTDCRTKNALFDATVRDEIIDSSKSNSSAVNSARRKTYCSLIYPKYQRVTNPVDTTNFVYYGLPGTFYNSSNAGTKFLYAESYNPASGGDSYKHYNTKTGTSNGNVGYADYTSTGSYAPTDSDLALGFDDFGRRMYWYYTSRTWFRNDSPGPGYLQVQAAMNDPANNTQKNALLTKLGGNRTPQAFENDETAYMTCSASDKNTCAHIINAGLTPTAGTLQSAIDYFKGTLVQGSAIASPIQYTCQRNFIIYVTDGLPSVNESGTNGNADALLPAVLTKLRNLRCPDPVPTDPSSETSDYCKVIKAFGATDKKFDVKTFVLGMGLNSAAKAKLDDMAYYGGTDVSKGAYNALTPYLTGDIVKYGGFAWQALQNSTGQTPAENSYWTKRTAKGGRAYYADNQTELNNGLLDIFQNILTQLSSGTAASILNNSEGSGANMLQAVFYPKKTFPSGSEVNWVGEMQNLWYYVDPFFQKSSIREDTVQDNKLNLKNDKIAQFYFDGSKTQVALFSDANGDGVADGAQTNVEPDDVKSLWKAGRLLWNRNVSDSATIATYDPRTVYTGFGSTGGATPAKFSTIDADGFVTSSAAWDAMQIPAGTVAARKAKAITLINWLKGTDQPPDGDGTTYRSRQVTIASCGLPDAKGCTREWKLGDIVASTPKLVSNVKLNNYGLPSPTGYSDISYNKFLDSTTYKTRGMVFVGANDGMLHAFKLGVLKELDGRFDKAQMNDAAGNRADAADKLGREEWAFIPTQTLPYLKYMTETNYNHLFYVDKTPTVVDASIGKPATCTETSYTDCPKDLTAGTNWRTVLIGGSGYGGAARNISDTCSILTDCVKTPLDGKGYSSYFALDVTDPAAPKYLWEFPAATAAVGSLGYATSGPAIIRIAKITKTTEDGKTTRTANNGLNGSWYAVFASGSTGPIEQINHEFRGQSDQNLKLFVVDLLTGDLKRTIDTGITNAFAGTITTGVIDTDRSRPQSPGWYSDDALYVGYTQKDTTKVCSANNATVCTADSDCTGYGTCVDRWTKGGIVRLLTLESDNPADWTTSVLIDQVKVSGSDVSVGPVTTSISKLQDRKNKNLWIYFGTGRYFYKNDDTSSGTTQKLFGVKEPCYTPDGNQSIGNDLLKWDGASKNKSENCADKSGTGLLDQSGDATTAPAVTLGTEPGWFIQLDPRKKVCSGDSSTTCTSDGDCGTDKGSCREYNSERVITDPVASTGGTVLFTTFKPGTDVCSFGGDSLVWALRYDTGAVPPARTMQGIALMQVSTGAFKEISLSTAFKNPTNKRLDSRRLSVPITGVPPASQGLSLLTNPPPVKKFLHVKEK